MNYCDQHNTPLADALLEEVAKKRLPFDVPGHKGNASYLRDFFGDACVMKDLNSRKDIDYLCEPRGVIRDAEALAAKAFHAKDAFFMVGGTTSSVQTMIMSACAPGDKIILPRNVHSSVINAVILSGATPVYLNPGIHKELGISLGVSLLEVTSVIEKNRDAKAVFLNNPTYYGICSDLKDIVKLAHANGMKVLVDEAHGTHFYFHEALPATAMEEGADMSAISIHKTGGSLTQSSMILSSGTIPSEHIGRVMNLTMTTSASYLLMASLDLARKNLALNGRAELDRILPLCRETRKSINEIGGFWAFGKDIVVNENVFDYDETKLSIQTIGIGLPGVKVYDILRDEFGIQLEFGDMNNVLALATIGDRAEYHTALVDALRRIKTRYGTERRNNFDYEYIPPQVAIPPREAFYSEKIKLPIRECKGRISGAFVMCYPPGIPILAPGEVITEEIISHILNAEEEGCSLNGLSGADLLVLK